MTRNLAQCSDDELITSFSQGNSLAFEELLLRYKNGLYQYLLSIVKDEGAAGDLFQEVFLALFTHAAGFKTQGKLKAWLFLTARNKAFNYLRDNKSISSLDEQDEEGNAFWHDIVPDDKPGQLEQLTRQENEEQLRQLVAQLPPRQQEVWSRHQGACEQRRSSHLYGGRTGGNRHRRRQGAPGGFLYHRPDRERCLGRLRRALQGAVGLHVINSNRGWLCAGPGAAPNAPRI